MDWPSHAPPAPWEAMQPVTLEAARPGRGRPRLNSEHPNRQHPWYMQDSSGMLVPAAPAPGQQFHRPAPQANRPASVVIHNNNWEDHSPTRRDRHPRRDRHHRRNSHGHEDLWDSDSDEVYEPRRKPSRRRHRSHSRSPSPMMQYDPDMERRLIKLEELELKEQETAQRKAAEQRKKLEDLEKAEKAKEDRKRYEEEQLAEAERKRQKEADDKKRKEAWIDDWKREEREKKEKEEKNKKEEDEAWRERTIKYFSSIGYSEESIAKILKDGEKKSKGEKAEKGDSSKHVMRPTYIKVSKEHMSTKTLEHFNIPWEYEQGNTKYILIKRWISEQDQDILFEHTDRMRKERQQKKAETTMVELQKRKKSGTLQLSRPARSRSRSRSWMFTG